MMTSPALRPAFSPADLGDTWVTTAPRRLDAEGLGELRGEVLDLHAEPAAVHLAVVDQLLHDLARHVDRDGEADADVAAAAREDGGVDADQLAAAG